MNNNNKLSVEIFGRQYHIVGQESANHMRHVASFVDEKMRDIASSNPHLDVARLAVLSAVNIADELIQLRKEHEELMELLEAVK